MQLIAAMGPPGGGRQAITERFLSKFNVIFMIFPDKGSIKRIFGTMLRQHLKEFDDEVKALGKFLYFFMKSNYKYIHGI